MDTETPVARGSAPVSIVIVLSVTVGGLLYVLGQYIASQPQRIEREAEAKREISVQGHGEVRAAPDVARITLGMETGVQPTAKVALDLLGKKFDGVVAAARSLGIKEEDIKTTNLSIRPEYDYNSGRQTVRGFSASESVEVKIRNLGTIGDVLAKTTAEGVNQAGGISFDIDDPTALQREAEEKAIKDAKENADHLAKSLDVRLGRVKAFATAASAPGPYPIFADRALVQMEKLAAPAAPPVPSGTQEIVANVTITFELK